MDRANRCNRVVTGWVILGYGWSEVTRPQVSLPVSPGPAVTVARLPLTSLNLKLFKIHRDASGPGDRT